MRKILPFYKGRKILVTGHTGFKGSWLCKILKMAGAEIIGYSLEPEGEENLYSLSNAQQGIQSVYADVRDLDRLMEVFSKEQPEIVFHLAAQPIVRTGYEQPVLTYETNVMGTVNILEAIRRTDSVRSVVNVTTDKVYENREWEWGYRENERLDGFDPYSNSKSCSELVTATYKRSFYADREVSISTARAGNVIGGGDFGKDRIIPDCMRACLSGNRLVIRNPYSVRPYQHVLEPLFAYLLIGERQYENKAFEGNYNVGPDDKDCITTGSLAKLFERAAELKLEGQKFEVEMSGNMEKAPHEAGFLKLDCSRLKQTFGWKPVWDIERAVEAVVEWIDYYSKRAGVEECMEGQIERYWGSWSEVINK